MMDKIIIIFFFILISCNSDRFNKVNDNNSNDTIYNYYGNGVLKSKGLKLHNFEIGWWVYYDLSGKVNKEIEYKLSNDTIYSNQILAFDKTGDIDYEKSRFYKIIIPDTLKLGKNTGELRNFSNFKKEDKNIYVVIKNKYKNGIVRNHTFGEKRDFTRFGINAHHVGKRIIMGLFVEEVWIRRTLGKDSISATQYKYKKYFEKEVYVKDTISKIIIK